MRRSVSLMTGVGGGPPPRPPPVLLPPRFSFRGLRGPRCRVLRRFGRRRGCSSIASSVARVKGACSTSSTRPLPQRHLCSNTKDRSGRQKHGTAQGAPATTMRREVLRNEKIAIFCFETLRTRFARQKERDLLYFLFLLLAQNAQPPRTTPTTHHKTDCCGWTNDLSFHCFQNTIDHASLL